MSFSDSVQQIRQWVDQGQTFLNDDLWQPAMPPVLTLRGLGYRTLRIIHMIVRGLREDQFRLHASSLTYNTLMSLVPLLAMSLAALKGLGYDEIFIERVTSYTSDMPEQFQNFLHGAIETVNKTNFAKMGGIGASVLVLMVVQVLSRIEGSFNSVWQISRSRSWIRRFTNYISIVVVVPILMVSAISLTARLKFGQSLFEQLGLLRFVPFMATWAAFTFLYKAMPNTMVKAIPSIIGGFIGAGMWHIWFRVYITIQPGVTQYNLLYGTLASIPIFLAWLYIAWMIVLIGAKVTYAAQRSVVHQLGTQTRISCHAQVAVALSLAGRCVAAFDRGESPQPLERYGHQEGIPPFLTDTIAQLLVNRGILAELAGNEGIYVPARSPAGISVGEIAEIVLDEGEDLKRLGVTGIPENNAKVLAQLLTPSTLAETTLAQWSKRYDTDEADQSSK